MINNENSNPNLASLTSRFGKNSSKESKGVVTAISQQDASRASKVFGILVHSETDSFLNSSLTYSPSPTAEKETTGRNMEEIIATSIAFNFDSTDDPDPLSLTERTDTLGNREKADSDSQRTIGSNLHEKTNQHSSSTNVTDNGTKNIFSKEELMRRMQLAVSSASKSVNDSLNAVRKAKKQKEQEKIVETQKFREAYRSETEEAALFQAEAERQRRELLALKNQEMLNFQRTKVEYMQAVQKERINAAMKESLFKSEVFRAHKKDLKEAEERRRRMSVDVRTKIRAENKNGMAKIEAMKLEEEQAIIDERYERSLALQQARSFAAAGRRKSLVFRNGDARRIRTLYANIQQQQKLQQHQSFELKWAAEKDAEEYKRQCEQERRESFAFRNQEGRKHREVLDRMKSEQLSADHESFELKWSAEKDAEEYKRQCDQERRESFAFRNQEGRKHREVLDRMKSEQLSAAHESFELKWAAEKDAEEYKRQCEQERRESFAFRNQEGRKHREVEEHMKSEQLSADHESFELKWAAEKDAEEYKRQCEQERRESFAFRNQEGRKHREVLDCMKSENLSAEHKSFGLKWAAEKDAEEYKRQCEQERRESFAFRNQEGRKHREVLDRMKSEQLSAAHESFELKWAAEKDAEEYKRQCEQERRESFAFRNQEGRKHREVLDRMKSEQLSAAHESFELKWAAEKDAEEYKRQCEQERRESFAFRNQEGRKHREVLDRMKSEQLSADHESFELKWAAEKDAEEYKRQCDQERRESFAFRNQEGRKHREVEEHMKSEQMSAEHESFELKWAAERDVDQYLKNCEEERRLSLQWRGQESVRHRAVMEELRSIMSQKEHESMVLKWAAEDDVKEYLDKCASNERASLVFRGKEARLRRLKEEDWKSQELEKMKESFELEVAAGRDVQAYVEKCKKRNRLSLAFRAKEKRRHANWEKQRAQMEIEDRSRETKNKALDARYVKLAQDRERAIKAIEAIRHAGRNFATNPFASLLD